MPLSAEKQQLVSSNVGIVFAVMQRLNIHGRGFAEAKSEAMLALCVAADSYTPSLGAFSTWAWAKVGWHLKTWMTKTNRLRAEVQERDAGLADAESLQDESATPDEAALGGQLERLIERALGPCTWLTREVALLALLGMTKEEIADELGVSVSTVARRRKQARELLSEVRQILSIVEPGEPWHNR